MKASEVKNKIDGLMKQVSELNGGDQLKPLADKIYAIRCYIHDFECQLGELVL